MTETEIKKLTDSLEHQPEFAETHISYLLLFEDFAYKIKKTLKLPFLDFQSLTSRKFYCEEELRLNRRLAEDMYVAVVPINAHQERLTIAGTKGEVIDYAVKMKRMDTALEMDKLLLNRQVKTKYIDHLVYKIADFHAKAPVIEKKQSLSALRAVFNEIEAQVHFVEVHLGKEEAQIIQRAIQNSDAFLKTNIDKIRERSRKGLVRDVHGDLHSKNIFLYEDPVIFDCIEFNPDFRQIDLLSEIAFFCMDLETREAPDLSRRFYTLYLKLMHEKQVGEVESKSLFTYFRLYRASVRAKVMALSAQEGAKPEDFSHQMQEVSKYIRLMKQYMDALKKENRD